MAHEILHDKTILVIEDNQVCQALIKAFLKGTGAEVLIAGTGEEAQKLLRRFHINLVITDLRLPDAEGVDLLKEIKKNNPGMPVIVQTASGIDFSRDECMEAGCDGYITKPYTRSELLDMIESCLE